MHVGIWPWRCWNSPRCPWNCSRICLAVCMPSLNILREQCIKGAPGPVKMLHYSWQLHCNAGLTSALTPGMRWLHIHHAGVHVRKRVNIKYHTVSLTYSSVLFWDIWLELTLDGGLVTIKPLADSHWLLAFNTWLPLVATFITVI